MARDKHIVKRGGHTEPFDEKKLYASIYAACLSVRTPVGEAELVADRVVKDVKGWLSKKHEVTSHDLRLQASRHLNVYDADAAYMYRHHRSLHH